MAGRPWTSREVGFLVENWGRPSTWDGWGSGLPGRSWRSIASQADRCGLRSRWNSMARPAWGAGEDEATRRYFSQMARAGHTPEACARRYKTALAAGAA